MYCFVWHPWRVPPNNQKVPADGPNLADRTFGRANCGGYWSGRWYIAAPPQDAVYAVGSDIAVGFDGEQAHLFKADALPEKGAH
jgi:hypothetical protein